MLVVEHATKALSAADRRHALELGCNRFHRRSAGTAYDPEVKRLYLGE
jgi:hypothetical protein